MNPLRTLFLALDGRLRPSWRFWISSVLFVLANSAAAMVTRMVVHVADVSSLGAAEAVYRPVALALALAAFWVMLRRLDHVDGNPLAAMGLGLDRPWLRESLLGTVLGAGMITLAVGAIVVLGDLSFRRIAGSNMVLYVLVDLWVLATAAMLEEVGFRGYPFQRLMEGIDAAGAILLFSVMFALVHVFNPHARLLGWGTLNTILIGAVLAIAYLRSRSLWLAWGIHFGWNAMLGLVFGLPVSGITQFAVVIQGEAEGPQWLTGGGYGIEASATGAVVILLGLAGVVALTPHPPASVTAGEANPPPEPASIPQQS